ncbi:MAG TPA: hypothetical protein VGR49_03310 [Actinomycetota bacterium]|nr:hypothetical protein [Actinomycetota bacterium]
MRRFFGIASLAVAIVVMGAPVAWADPDPDLTPSREMVIHCDDGDHEVVVLNGGIHLVDGNGMFLPKVVWVNGNLVVKNNGVEQNAIDDAECSWTTLSGRSIVALGHFTPANKG